MATILHGGKTIELQAQYQLCPGGPVLIRTDRGYQIDAQSPIKLNGRAFTGTKPLKDKTIIIVGADRFIFYDEESAAKEETDRATRIKSYGDLEKQYDLDEIKKEAKSLFVQFVNEREGTRSLKAFSTAFCQYLKKFCRLDRAILYATLEGGKKWKALAWEYSEKEYYPPMKVLRAVYVSGAPDFFQANEKAAGDLSLSIVANKIKSAFCFPIYDVNQVNCIAVFYGDSVTEEINNRLFVVANFLCQYIGKHLATFATKTQKKRIDGVGLKEIKLPDKLAIKPTDKKCPWDTKKIRRG